MNPIDPETKEITPEGADKHNESTYNEPKASRNPRPRPNLILATITVIAIVIAVYIELQNINYNQKCNEYYKQQITERCPQPEAIQPWAHNINISQAAATHTSSQEPG